MILLLMTLFITKHFVVDFLYQPEWMWKNKGNMKHYGGYAHAGLHSLVTFIILFWINPVLAVICALLEGVVHYIIDFNKMNIVKSKGWAANTHNEFWVALGVDQMLHYFCYVVIVLVITGGIS